MRPTLLKLGVLEFHAYTVMLSIAFLVCTLLAVRENYRRPRPFPITPAVGIFIALGGMVGAKAYWYLQFGPISQIYRSVFIWEGGLVYYGGLIGGFAAGVGYMLFKRVPLLPMGDIALPYLPLGIGITRVGCFLNGCCWGRPTGMPWGICFPKNSLAWRQHVEEHLLDADAAHSLPVHPTQLYSVAGLLLIFAFMRWAYKHPHRDGSIMLLYPLLYGVMRFTVEAFRGDSARLVLNLTASQVVSLLLVLVAVLGYAALWYRGGRCPDEEQVAEDEGQ